MTSSISKLSNRELLRRLELLIARERATTLEILRHLCEVEKRMLFLPLGYSSLFSYCTESLGYSRSAAGRRIAAARCLRDYPEFGKLLAKDEVNLMTVSLVAQVIRPANKDEIIDGIRGKSQYEVEKLVAQYRGPGVYGDRVRPVSVKVPAGACEKSNNPHIWTPPSRAILWGYFRIDCTHISGLIWEKLVSGP